MAIKHHAFTPVRHAVGATAGRIHIAGAAIVKGAPVVENADGRVIEATEGAASAKTVGNGILGIAQDAAAAAGDEVLVAYALSGERFLGSLTDLAAGNATDDGTKALAEADIGDRYNLRKDDTTLKWALAEVSATGPVRLTALVDKVGATSNDAAAFGASGTETFPNSGKALVEFTFLSDATAW